jgi:mRNA interferase MazF
MCWHTGGVASDSDINDSKAQVEAMRAANVSRLIKRFGHAPDDLMAELDAKVRMHLKL